MVSYRAVVVAVLLVALLMAAAAAGATPTRASWAKAANSVCAVENTQVRSLPKVTSQTFLADLEAIAKYATQAVNRLAAIPPPPAEGELIASMIAKIKAQNKLVLGTAIPAARHGDAATTNSAMARVGKLGDQATTVARRVGAATCAANPTPNGNSLAA
jgi:hypothetical protein